MSRWQDVSSDSTLRAAALYLTMELALQYTTRAAIQALTDYDEPGRRSWLTQQMRSPCRWGPWIDEHVGTLLDLETSMAAAGDADKAMATGYRASV